MAGRKQFHFAGILHAAPGADSTPSFIVQGNRPQMMDVILRIKNLTAVPITFRFLKSQTGSLNLTDPPTRGSWAAQSGPFTIAKDGELTFSIRDIAQRIALSVDEEGKPICSLTIDGHAYNDVNAFNGILDAVVDAGGVVVEQGGEENFVYGVNGVPSHDFSQLSYYGSTNNLQYARYYLGADQVVVSGSATAAANGTYTRRGINSGKSYYTLVGAADDINNAAISWNGSTWTLYNAAGSGIATNSGENPWDAGWTNSVVGTGPDFQGAFEYLYVGDGAADDDKLTQVRRL